MFHFVVVHQTEEACGIVVPLVKWLIKLDVAAEAPVVKGVKEAKVLAD